MLLNIYLKYYKLRFRVIKTFLNLHLLIYYFLIKLFKSNIFL